MDEYIVDINKLKALMFEQLKTKKLEDIEVTLVAFEEVLTMIKSFEML